MPTPHPPAQPHRPLAPAATPFGIMQGRLVPPEEGRFQSFPRNRWRDEFPRANQAGIDYIEWIIDAYGEDINPILSPTGLTEFDALKQKHNIATPALCADWFMDYPFLRCTPDQLAERERFLHALIPIAARIGADHIIIPCVDISRIETEADKQTLLNVLTTAAPVAAANHVELHLETDLNSADFAALLARIPHPFIKANYDSGNSSGLGYIASEEFAAYGDRIGSIHIKDRRSKYAGGIATMPLGTGSADFDDVFAAMQSIHYKRGITLQVARGTDDDEAAWIASQLAFVKQYWQ